MFIIPKSGFLYTNENFDVDPTQLESDISKNELEMTESIGSLDEANQQINEAENAAIGLESIAENIEKLNEVNNGIDEPTAELIEASVESLLKISNVGITYKRLGLPTTESFSNKAKRKELGIATIEGIKDVASNIWQGILSSIRKVRDWIKNLFKKIFNSSEKIQEKADAIEAKINEKESSSSESTEEKPNEDAKDESREEFKDEKETKEESSDVDDSKIMVGDELATPEHFSRTAKLITEVGNIQKEFVKECIDIVKDAIDAIDKSSKEGMIKRIVDKSKRWVSHLFKRKPSNNQIKDSVGYTDLMPGDVSISYVLNDKGIDFVAFKENTVKKKRKQKVPDYSTGKKYTHEIKVCDQSVKDYTKQADELDNEINDVLKKVEEALKKPMSADKEKNLKAAALQLKNAITDPLAKICPSISMSCNAMLNTVKYDLRLP